MAWWAQQLLGVNGPGVFLRLQASSGTMTSFCRWECRPRQRRWDSSTATLGRDRGGLAARSLLFLLPKLLPVTSNEKQGRGGISQKSLCFEQRKGNLKFYELGIAHHLSPTKLNQRLGRRHKLGSVAGSHYLGVQVPPSTASHTAVVQESRVQVQ